MIFYWCLQIQITVHFRAKKTCAISSLEYKWNVQVFTNIGCAPNWHLFSPRATSGRRPLCPYSHWLDCCPLILTTYFSLPYLPSSLFNLSLLSLQFFPSSLFNSFPPFLFNSFPSLFNSFPPLSSILFLLFSSIPFLLFSPHSNMRG